MSDSGGGWAISRRGRDDIDGSSYDPLAFNTSPIVILTFISSTFGWCNRRKLVQLNTPTVTYTPSLTTRAVFYLHDPPRSLSRTGRDLHLIDVRFYGVACLIVARPAKKPKARNDRKIAPSCENERFLRRYQRHVRNDPFNEKREREREIFLIRLLRLRSMRR